MQVVGWEGDVAVGQVGASTGWLARLSTLRWPGRAAVLCVVVLALWAVLAPVAYSVRGAGGLGAMSVAAALCLAGSLVALMLVALFHSASTRQPGMVLYGWLAGIVVRTGVPLVAALVIHRGSGLSRLGFLYYLLGFYLLTLVVETILSLPELTQEQAVAAVAGPVSVQAASATQLHAAWSRSETPDSGTTSNPTQAS